jgi:membrane protease YdiL (CAAX protease family)
VNFLGNIGLWAILLWVVTYGFGEEIGWRGFALPRLQKDHSALVATLILGTGWAIWHLPAFWYLPTFMELGLAGFPAVAMGVLVGSVVYTWLYNSTGGSICALAVWHGLYDFFVAARPSEGVVAAIMSILIVLWAVVVLLAYGPATLSRSPKATAELAGTA